jgi:L-2-hydroxyglutarate oxidase LhgO
MLVGARDAYQLRALRPRDLLSTLSWPGTWIVAKRFWRTGIHELHMAASRKAFVQACAEYVPAIEAMKIDPSAASGVRAQAVGRGGQLLDDFAISQTPGATHVRNAPSPAATSSLALARELVDRFEAAGN